MHYNILIHTPTLFKKIGIDEEITNITGTFSEKGFWNCATRMISGEETNAYNSAQLYAFVHHMEGIINHKNEPADYGATLLMNESGPIVLIETNTQLYKELLNMGYHEVCMSSLFEASFIEDFIKKTVLPKSILESDSIHIDMIKAKSFKQESDALRHGITMDDTEFPCGFIAVKITEISTQNSFWIYAYQGIDNIYKPITDSYSTSYNETFFGYIDSANEELTCGEPGSMFFSCLPPIENKHEQPILESHQKILSEFKNFWIKITADLKLHKEDFVTVEDLSGWFSYQYNQKTGEILQNEMKKNYGEVLYFSDFLNQHLEMLKEFKNNIDTAAQENLIATFNEQNKCKSEVTPSC